MLATLHSHDRVIKQEVIQVNPRYSYLGKKKYSLLKK